MTDRRRDWRRLVLAAGGVALGGYVGHDVGLRLSYATRPDSGVLLLNGLGRAVDAWTGVGVGALVVGGATWLLAGRRGGVGSSESSS